MFRQLKESKSNLQKPQKRNPTVKSVQQPAAIPRAAITCASGKNLGIRDASESHSNTSTEENQQSKEYEESDPTVVNQATLRAQGEPQSIHPKDIPSVENRKYVSKLPGRHEVVASGMVPQVKEDSEKTKHEGLSSPYQKPIAKVFGGPEVCANNVAMFVEEDSHPIFHELDVPPVGKKKLPEVAEVPKESSVVIRTKKRAATLDNWISKTRKSPSSRSKTADDATSRIETTTVEARTPLVLVYISSDKDLAMALKIASRWTWEEYIFGRLAFCDAHVVSYERGNPYFFLLGAWREEELMLLLMRKLGLTLHKVKGKETYKLYLQVVGWVWIESEQVFDFFEALVWWQANKKDDSWNEKVLVDLAHKLEGVRKGYWESK